MREKNHFEDRRLIRCQTSGLADEKVKGQVSLPFIDVGTQIELKLARDALCQVANPLVSADSPLVATTALGVLNTVLMSDSDSNTLRKAS